MNWKDIAHYGTAALLMLVGGVTELGVALPGIVVTDPKAVMMTGFGILVAGLKAGWTAK